MPKRITYNKLQGVTAFSPVGHQYATSFSRGSFYHRSALFDITNNWKFSTDNCWETGTIWQINGAKVIKRLLYGDIISSVTLGSPRSLSVVQPSVIMPSFPQYFGEDDLGAWVTDAHLKQLIRYDADMNVVSTVSGLSKPMMVVSDIDGGCYYADDIDLKIYKVDNDATVSGNVDYSTVSSYLVDSSDIKNMKIDSSGTLWVGFEKEIVGLVVVDGVFTSTYLIIPSNDFSADPLFINDFDVDRGSIPNYIYATGGCPDSTWIAKYDVLGNYISSNSLSIYFPMLIGVSQLPGSDAIYILDETDETFVPIECVSSSSDSSSSISSLSSESSSSQSISSSSSQSMSSTSVDDCPLWTEGVWAQWKLNDNISTSNLLDASVNGRDVALTNGPDAGYEINSSSRATSGQLSGAMLFNGGEIRGFYGSNLPASNGSDSIIITAWIYINGWGADNHGRIIDDTRVIEGVRTGGYEFYVDSDGHLKFSADGGITKIDSTLSGISLGGWTFVGIWNRGTSARFWIDSGWDGAAQTVGSHISGDNIYIGNRLGEDFTYDRGFDGKIDNVIVMNYNISENDSQEFFEGMYSSGIGTENLYEWCCGGVPPFSSSSSSLGSSSSSSGA